MDIELKDKLINIKTLIFPFEGVLTNGFIYLDAEEREMIRYSLKDLEGLKQLKKELITIIVLTSNSLQITQHICKKVGLQCWKINIDTGSKRNALLGYLDKKTHLQNEVAYIGSDQSDLEAMKLIGTKLAVSDCHPKIKGIADYVTHSAGGYHVIREVCDLILDAKMHQRT